MKFPFSVVKRADLPGLEPPRDAMEVESVVADSPGNRALFTSGRCLVSLTFDTWKAGSENKEGEEERKENRGEGERER